MEESDLSLSAEALKALLEFQQEEEERRKKFEELATAAEKRAERAKQVQQMELFQEDWQLSQFWYTNATADLYADALLDGADENTVIALLSTPSVYAAILRKPASSVPTEHIYLFEYDRRFELLAGKEHFCFYDFNKPLELPDSIRGKVDRIIIDPPFLNKPCQANFATTTSALLTSGNKSDSDNCRIIVSTGERMASIVTEQYPSLRVTTYHPSHTNGLSNEFYCYANFEWPEWKFV